MIAHVMVRDNNGNDRDAGWMGLPVPPWELPCELEARGVAGQEARRTWVSEMRGVPLEEDLSRAFGKEAPLRDANSLAKLIDGLDENELRRLDAYLSVYPIPGDVSELAGIAMQTDKMPLCKYDWNARGLETPQERFAMTWLSELSDDMASLLATDDALRGHIDLYGLGVDWARNNDVVLLEDGYVDLDYDYVDASPIETAELEEAAFGYSIDPGWVVELTAQDALERVAEDLGMSVREAGVACGVLTEGEARDMVAASDPAWLDVGLALRELEAGAREEESPLYVIDVDGQTSRATSARVFDLAVAFERETAERGRESLEETAERAYEASDLDAPVPGEARGERDR